MIEWINANYPGAFFDCAYDERGQLDLDVYVMSRGQEVRLGKARTIYAA